MEVRTLADQRKVAVARRRPAGRFQLLEVPADGDGDHGPVEGPFPDELRLELTTPVGQLVNWFDDAWWLETLRRWKDKTLAIHVLPSPDALFHPCVLHELEMVRRVQAPWKLIGHCYRSDVAHPMLVQRLAINPYDDIRIIDADRPATDAYEVRPSRMSFVELYEQVRTTQSAERSDGPLLTRAPANRV